MNHTQKYSNRPMFVLKHIRHGGCYEYYKHYIDMDVADPAISADFYATGQSHIYTIGFGLDPLQRQKNRDGNAALCRPC